jgi:acyl-coenzyme A synthetase/AMP-(fatty) acid ligase
LTFPDVLLWNLYGPTEACIYVTGALMDVETDEVSIGRALPGSFAIVLDEQLQMVPDGVKGELCVGGLGLSRGYLNRPDLDAERFVIHPETNQKVYRTGDLVIQQYDGTIVFLGRMDAQVKVNGYRIELGEIETVLQQYPGVETAVVVFATFGTDNKGLVAYLKGAIDLTGVRTFLSSKLPLYMLPVDYRLVQDFPKTSSGKIDRNALTTLDRLESAEELEREFTLMEDFLAESWSELLSIDKQSIALKNDFFLLGGQSIKAIKLINCIREKQGIELKLKEVFLHS